MHADPRILRTLAAVVTLSASQVMASEERALEATDLHALRWRSVGPANMGGRVAALAMSDADPKILFVGYATGGLWKSTNHGTTFTPIFDDQATASIGALACVDVGPDWKGWGKDADERTRREQGAARIVWVGTGEGNGRNSSSWGNGVYRSVDGGRTFEHLGLEETHDIPALAVDPRDPDVCYIAALGHLWGPNPERGVYRTRDGGASWEQVLGVDDETGACDVIVRPDRPDTVFAALYQRLRTPWSFRSGGPEGGIYRSRDAGDTWEKLDAGLPERTGRIGLWICLAAPDTMYAAIESAENGHVGETIEDRSRGGGVFRSDDGGDTWERTTDFLARPFYFSRIRTDPHDCERVYLPGFHVAVSDDGGRGFYNAFTVPHVDYHAMLIDPSDPDHLIVGNDGGVYVSWDRGATWDFRNSMAVGQFYNVAVDDSTPYRIAGGLQDNGSWIGTSEVLRETGPNPFMGRSGAITNKDWHFLNGGDGFVVAFDPTDRNVLYAESQGGYLRRVHLHTGQTRLLRPSAREGEPRFRFNWNAPFFVSPHDPTTLYLGGNHVFRLEERGDRWTRISPDLSTNDVTRVVTVGSQAETAGTIVALAESPLEAGVLWAGTDEGLVHVSPDGGASWRDVTPEAAEDLYVACLEPSAHAAQRVYAAIDGHRSDVFTPLLLRSDDLGATWTNVTGDLPTSAPVDVVREDPTNPDVLYVGTEQAAYVSIDGGTAWVKLNGTTLPTVRVDDLAIQRTEHDLVAGTHGRSVWVLDDATPIAQLTPAIVRSEFHVFTPLPGRPRQRLDTYELVSDAMFIAPNPPVAAHVDFWLAERVDEPVTVTISTPKGRTVRTLEAPSRRGVNRVAWDLQAEPEQRLGTPHGVVEYVPAGTYRVEIRAGEHVGRVDLAVEPEPGRAHVVGPRD